MIGKVGNGGKRGKNVWRETRLAIYGYLDEESSVRMLRTLEAHAGVRTKLGYRVEGFLNLVVIVVAVDFIALVVYKWRVSANNGALVTGVIYNLGGC